MISSLALERPGRWRVAGIGLLLGVIAAPDVLLLRRALEDTAAGGVEWSFVRAIGRSGSAAGGAALAGLVCGLPLGVGAALYRFPGRALLLALATLPLLVPSFLWAIGWSSLAAALGAPLLLSGLPACALVFAAGLTVPLVLLTAYAATASLTGSQVDAARLAGGEREVMWQASRNASAPALLAAALGGVLTLADPGPGQIFAVRTAASETLTSFAALYDFGLAGRQCAALAGLVLMGAVPLALLATARFADDLLARQTRPLVPVTHARVAALMAGALTVLALAATVLPTLGLWLPMVAGEPALLPRTTRDPFQMNHPELVLLGAMAEVGRTAVSSFLYAGGAAAVALLLGVGAAVCVGRDRRLRAAWLAAALTLFCVPPALPALGIVELATSAPAWADPLLRSRLTVCMALGLRLVPVSSVIALRAWASTAPSWAIAAALHGVPFHRYAARVLAPSLRPAAGVCLLLVALLASADVTTVLLVHPPGEASLSLTIFTVMANAPELLVSALCLVYIAGAAAVLACLWGSSGAH
jgi:iron(III) transport system permease protein